MLDTGVSDNSICFTCQSARELILRHAGIHIPRFFLLWPTAFKLPLCQKSLELTTIIRILQLRVTKDSFSFSILPQLRIPVSKKKERSLSQKVTFLR